MIFVNSANTVFNNSIPLGLIPRSLLRFSPEQNIKHPDRLQWGFLLVQLVRRVLLLAFILFTIPAYAAKSTIGILVFDGVLTSDVTAPAEVFGTASNKAWFSDYDVKLIGVSKSKKVTTEEGLQLTVDNTIYDNIKLDALIVSSAYEVGHLLENSLLTKFLKDQAQQVSWLASNCSGAYILGNAGLLDNIKATTWAGGEDRLQRKFPEIRVVKDQNVVVDGNVITSNGSVVSYQSALVLLAKISSENNAKEVYEAIQLNRLVSWSEIQQMLKS